ncbi:MAG: metabolite traffic protein EboE [Ferruginibacter sp.]|nr:metabolite traffic protein EboE [Ferruginibacter sp.]
MLTNNGHLTYCTNIHTGENWQDHFAEIKKYFPSIKNELSPDKPMGIGLRLSNIASEELLLSDNLATFQQWLSQNNAYVFTINGFPYGGFHNVIVKDQVHAPDWTTSDRVDYTIRLFDILKKLLPAEMEGGISTSPLSYKYWHNADTALQTAVETATENIIKVIIHLIEIHTATGQILHLDIEPEPDGILETGKEFIDWFMNHLLPAGEKLIAEKFTISAEEVQKLIKQHLRLCYDVCHFAIGYEPHKEVIEKLMDLGIQIGKIQISAALKAIFNNDVSDRNIIKEKFENFNEPTYLHQVVARKLDGALLRYPDLPQALADIENTAVEEWRAHFHVPIFEENLGFLQSTQKDIVTVLNLQKKLSFTQHLEVETYTWDVIAPELKLPMQESIIRELKWVDSQLK